MKDRVWLYHVSARLEDEWKEIDLEIDFFSLKIEYKIDLTIDFCMEIE